MRSVKTLLAALAIVSMLSVAGAGCWPGDKKDVQKTSSAPTGTAPGTTGTAPTTTQPTLVIVLMRDLGIEYTIDPNRSVIRWQAETAKKQTIQGAVRLASGDFGVPVVNNPDRDFKGKVEIDMRALIVDEKSAATATLEKQLRGDKYLNIEKFPIATLEITNIIDTDITGTPPHRYTVEGKFKLKGKDKTVTFPIFISRIENELHLTGRVPVSQKGWSTWFNNLGKLVGDPVNLDLDIIANKKS